MVLKDFEPSCEPKLPTKQSDKMPLKHKSGSKGSSIVDIMEAAPRSEFKKEKIRTKPDETLDEQEEIIDSDESSNDPFRVSEKPIMVP